MYHGFAELSAEGLVHPPLPIPAPPVFEVDPTAQESKTESPHAIEGGRALLSALSQASGTQDESAEAAQRALPDDDDDDFEEDEQVQNQSQNPKFY